ncbi:unnamed protein product [Leptosia nina]|uniref:RNA helicase n=1 Tax=Leptosia nina TaxID=320188 RepID=A0AAV1K476_9NEOP
MLAHKISDAERTTDVLTCYDTSFNSMMLSTYTLNGLTMTGFSKPSPIQLLGIPLGKLGFDLILEAKSGTGKTVVFSTIALELLNLQKGLQVIIVTPTREIAAQICDVIKQIGSHFEGLTTEMVIGGLPYREDVEKVNKNVHILIGTPGRLKHLINDKHINTCAVRLFVLDEADKLMENSFQDDIKCIHKALPGKKQVILSSATFPESIKEVVDDLVEEAQHVCPTTSNVLLGITHKVTLVKYNSNIVKQTENRFNELARILSEIEFKQCVIFCKYQARVSQLHKMLKKSNWPSDLVYGKQAQTVRLEALKTLQEYKCRILIATDLVSRGIDAKNVNLVINFEPPDNCETYLHRIGRSGRYGSIGMAVSIISEGEEFVKFNKMLEPIAHTINIQNFWTKENITNNQENNTEKKPSMKICEISNTKNNDECKGDNSLWNSLVGNLDNSGNLESFDQLCISYATEDSKSKTIASFSELLEDYTNDVNVELEDSTYKHVEFENVSHKTYFDAIHRCKQELDIFSNDIGHKIRTSTEKLPTVENSTPSKRINDSKINNKHSPEYTSYTNTNAFLTELPQSFHKTKYKYGPKNEIKHNTLKKKITEHNDSYSAIHNGVKTYESVRYQNQLDDKEEIIKADGCRNILDKEVKNNFSKTKDINYKLKTGKEKDFNIQETHNKRNIRKVQAYCEWYNKLKTTTKQIELLLYMEEMSNY